MARNQRRNKRNKPGGGSSQTANRSANRVDDDRSVAAVAEVHPRSSTETKPSRRTTELVAYALAVLAVVMTALALDEDGRGGGDPFGAEPAIRYITYLTIGYMVARGLAKSGSHENRVEHHADVDDTEGTVVVRDEDHEPDEDVDAEGGTDRDATPAVRIGTVHHAAPASAPESEHATDRVTEHETTAHSTPVAANDVDEARVDADARP